MDVNLAPILLVEDSAADIRLTREALRDARIANELYVVRDGVQAMEFLRQTGAFAHAPRPQLMILDLNLPRMDGMEVLRMMKSDLLLRPIPVAVLTTSSEDVDILKSYQLGANCYLTKPLDLGQFIMLVRTLEEFWLGLVQLPSPTESPSA